ncbi:hypothetical protein [Jiangella rhizosphaerae]|uniref:Ribbon-helix-helix protein, CopG family n=1 Tax=Jiangella rhizosphaerae TaxID=2293569 RepID=A0A418KV06_9ACTN|nr:hypothetical protein [Jiangella rhizosphaerae]RIQ33610.1 hypothetical protein DY240_04885 [Jiangella rhizosphaerae]
MTESTPTAEFLRQGTNPAVDTAGLDDVLARRSVGGAVTHDDAAPVIKPSVVHVPSSLLSLVAAERRRSGRSNGEILIDAIEAGHDHLVKLHHESNSIGGRLFTARTAKPQLPVAQPLSPLNIRLYEQDYEVLDRLVTELGAGSRSRLATLALALYLDSST